VCILGFAVFFDVNRRFPSDFYYDDEGVRINFDYDGKGKWVEFPWEELVQIKETKAADLFYHLEQVFRRKIREGGSRQLRPRNELWVFLGGHPAGLLRVRSKCIAHRRVTL
jgi:hypothetical protein